MYLDCIKLGLDVVHKWWCGSHATVGYGLIQFKLLNCTPHKTRPNILRCDYYYCCSTVLPPSISLYVLLQFVSGYRLLYQACCAQIELQNICYWIFDKNKMCCIFIIAILGIVSLLLPSSSIAFSLRPKLRPDTV